MSAACKFKSVLSGGDYEGTLNIEAITEDDADADDGPDDDNENEEGDDTADDVSHALNEPNTDNTQTVGESIAQSNLFLWKFPAEVSQSTLDGRNGSSACSVIALIFAQGARDQRLDLQPTPLLSRLWVMLLCASIIVGNRLYDLYRHSLPQRFLSASEAATIVERCVKVSVNSPLPVRVLDEHAPQRCCFS